jgi:uncharacterized membrane protein
MAMRVWIWTNQSGAVVTSPGWRRAQEVGSSGGRDPSREKSEHHTSEEHDDQLQAGSADVDAGGGQAVDREDRGACKRSLRRRGEAMTITALARYPPGESIRAIRFREHVSTTLWFIPGLFVAGAILLSKLTVAADRSAADTLAPRWIVGGDADSAAALTATVAAAMLAFVAVVFTTTLVAIQLAGGQYSPRVVRVFVRSRLTQVTLGLFLATFVFALNGLVEIRGGDPPLVPAITVSVVYALVLATLVVFVLFVHGMSRMLRVQYLLDHITTEGRQAISAAFPEHDELVEVAVPEFQAGRLLMTSKRIGVIQALDRAGLVETARRAGVVLDLLVECGEYVGVGTPIARVVPGQQIGLSGDDIAVSFLLGAERTPVHDPGFVLRQLVDIAIRALSPAVNDPTTAVQVIDRIEDLLGEVVHPDPTGWYLDCEGVARVHLSEPGFDRLLLLAYVEIIRYGADSPQVVRRLRAAFAVLDTHVRNEVDTLESLRTMLDQSVVNQLPTPLADVARHADRHGIG